MKTYKLVPYPVTLRVQKVSDIDETSSAQTAYDGSYVTVTLSKDATIKEAVHEAVHVTQAVADYIQTKLDFETEAYLTARVFELIAKSLL